MDEIKLFKIRDIEINPPLVLSPMAGVTDVSFRRLLKQRGGIGLTVSEFISVEGLTRNNPKSRRRHPGRKLRLSGSEGCEARRRLGIAQGPSTTGRDPEGDQEGN